MIYPNNVSDFRNCPTVGNLSNGRIRMAKLTKEEAEKLLDEIRWIGCEFYPDEDTDISEPLTKSQLSQIKTRIDVYTKYEYYPSNDYMKDAKDKEEQDEKE